MLANLLDRYISNGTALLYALVGFVVVFIGIAFLILIVWAVGKIMSKNTAQAKPQKQEKPKAVETVKECIAVADADAVSEETLAVIMAALMAYYQQTNPKCEFTVKRIKRI